MSLPSILIIDVGESYKAFGHAIADPDLPTIDEDAVLSLVVDALRCRQTTEQDLCTVQRQMVEGECLSEKTLVDDLNNDHYFSEESKVLKSSLTHVALLAKGVGYQLNQQVKQFRLYEDDYFNYEYEGMINNGTLILRRCG